MSAYFAQARFEVDAGEGRLTLDRSSVAVEAVSTAGQRGDNASTVTSGKVHSEEAATPNSDKASVDAPDLTSSLGGAEGKGTPKDNQGGEVKEEEKTITEEEESVQEGAMANEATATEERRLCETVPPNTTEEASKIRNHGNHLHDAADRLVCSAGASQPSPLSSNGSVLSFTTCKLPS